MNPLTLELTCSYLDLVYFLVLLFLSDDGSPMATDSVSAKSAFVVVVMIDLIELRAELAAL